MEKVIYPLTYGGLSQGTDICLSQLFREGSNWSRGYCPEDGDASRCRSNMATQFIGLPSKPKIMAMVDHDMIWSRGDLDLIADVALQTKGVCGGLVSKRSVGQGYGTILDDGVIAEIGSNRVVEIKSGKLGGAFVAIHRDVLGKLTKVVPFTRQGFYHFFPSGSFPVNVEDEDGDWDFYSEDWGFGRMCRAIGVTVSLHLKPIISHAGQYLFGPMEGVGL